MGACPPEDIGGIGGFYDFLEAINDAKQPEHEDMLERHGGAFDPAAFDFEERNKRFRARGRRCRDAQHGVAYARRAMFTTKRQLDREVVTVREHGGSVRSIIGYPVAAIRNAIDKA